ncbi:hypothetical protein FQN54_009543 [Arachnomyces sp. PD_36]|nr:hypothetical protein FQN54_009543 [Arachnomyces sp. PD_36]
MWSGFMLPALAACLSFASCSIAAANASEYEGYAFIYFTGDTDDNESIFIATSEGNDALSWVELNGGEPILTSTEGTTGVRDPFVIRSPEGDTFFLIATDLKVADSGWDGATAHGSRYLEIWESPDLINWSDQRHVLVSPETAGNTWAPEATYDESLGEYVVYWASALYDEEDPEHTGSSYDRLLCATTSDFITFSEPAVWQDAGNDRIDSTVLEVDGIFHRFTKDDGSRDTGCTDIIQESSADLLAPYDNWDVVATCIGTNTGLGDIEGPLIFKSNPTDVNGGKFYLFVDEHSDRGYLPLETEDISAPEWKISESYNLPSSPRHGSVVPVTSDELSALQNAYQKQKRRSTEQLQKRDSPVLPGLYADPNIAIFNCTYYIYATTDGYDDWGGKDFYVWKSPDLVSWTRSDEPFLTLDGESGNVPWADGNAWAPTIIERGGKYYFYFSGNEPSAAIKMIGVAVADSPEGPFAANEEPMIYNDEVVTTGQAIDPCAFHDPVSGKYYFFWGNGSPLYAELNDDMVSINWETAAGIDGLFDFTEGLFVNYRDGLYHLTYSVGNTGKEDYHVNYATSTNITGPWTYQGVILEREPDKGVLAAGHSSIINVPETDDWYIAYHRFAIPDGDGNHRETTIDRVDFDGETGLMVKVVPTLESVEAEVIPGC